MVCLFHHVIFAPCTVWNYSSPNVPMPDVLTFIKSSTEFDYDHVIICPSCGSLLDSLTTCTPARCFITPLSIAFAVSFTDDSTLLFSWTQFNYHLWPQKRRRGLSWVTGRISAGWSVIDQEASDDWVGEGSVGGVTQSIDVSWCVFVYETEQNER